MRDCPFCGGEAGASVETREMMFGLRDPFTYSRCDACGSLWLPDPPRDLGRYYGPDYYSLRAADPKGADTIKPAILWLQILLRLPVHVADKMAGTRGFPAYIRWFSRIRGVRPDHRIADIGSGEGNLVYQLARHGFRDVWGFDPYLSADRDVGSAHLRQGSASSADGLFDVVMFNHSLEHTSDPVGTLRAAAAKLKPAGAVLVRTPVAGSWADQHYGRNWVGLDTPRHLAIPSQRGTVALANATGLRVAETFFDSTWLQFWGSERYRSDQPLRSDPPPSANVRTFERRARELNQRGAGDTAGYILRLAQLPHQGRGN